MRKNIPSEEKIMDLFKMFKKIPNVNIDKKYLLAGAIIGVATPVAYYNRTLLYSCSWTVWQFSLLVIGYTLAWFLSTACVFVFTAGARPASTMSTAAVLGLLAAILHAIVCHFAGNACNF